MHSRNGVSQSEIVTRQLDATIMAQLAAVQLGVRLEQPIPLGHRSWLRLLEPLIHKRVE